MSLLEKIDGGMLRTLAGSTSSSSSSSVVSSLNGKGAGASFDSSGVDVSAGLSRMISAFQASAVRIVKPLNTFQNTRDTLEQLSKLADHMLEIAKRSSGIETTDDQRGALAVSFNRDAKEFRRLLDASVEQDFDFRSKSDLESALSDAGIDVSQSTTLSEAFAKLAASDGEVGYSHFKNEDVAITTIAGVTQVYRANGSSDPLNQDVTTQGGGQVAVNTLTKLRDDLKNDSKQVQTVIEELVGAGNFAIHGANEATVLSSAVAGTFTPQQLADKLVTAIRADTSDPLLSAHSDLDRNLANVLLSDPNA